MSIAILPSNAILHLPSPRVCHEECSIGNSRASRVVRRQDFIRVHVMPQEEETLWIPVLASQTAPIPVIHTPAYVSPATAGILRTSSDAYSW